MNFLQELNAAATKIQAVQKGRMAREEVAAMKKGTASGEAAPEAADAVPESAAAPEDAVAPGTGLTCVETNPDKYKVLPISA